MSQAEVKKGYSAGNIEFNYFQDKYEIKKHEFTSVHPQNKNKVTPVPLSNLAKDQASFTGSQEGFFSKFGSEEVK